MKSKFANQKKDEDFQTLQKSVQQFKNELNEKKANRNALITGGMLTLVFFFGIIHIAFFHSNLTLYYFSVLLLGVLSVPLVLVIGHEAVHGNFTGSKKVNRFATNVFYLLGTSPYFWNLRHLYSHHHYTNIKNLDLDIEQSSLIRLDNSQPHKKFHRFQAFYMPILFLFYTLNWFFLRDFKDLNKKNYGNKKIEKHPIDKIVKLILAKVWHFSFLIIIPLFMGQTLLPAILGFFIFHFSASLTTTLVLVSTHIGLEHELLHEQEELPYSWVEHQIKTSGDFSTNSKFSLYFFGGFNHHLAHHLFPNVPYILYPKITPLIKAYCEKKEYPYHHFPNLFSCISSHFLRLIKYSGN